MVEKIVSELDQTHSVLTLLKVKKPIGRRYYYQQLKQLNLTNRSHLSAQRGYTEMSTTLAVSNQSLTGKALEHEGLKAGGQLEA